jgi:hypothetical protein
VSGGFASLHIAQELPRIAPRASAHRLDASAQHPPHMRRIVRRMRPSGGVTQTSAKTYPFNSRVGRSSSSESALATVAGFLPFDEISVRMNPGLTAIAATPVPRISAANTAVMTPATGS